MERDIKYTTLNRSEATRPAGESIPLSRPSISEREKKAVQEVLASGRLSCGPNLEAFERSFRSYLGVREAVGVSSGTAGLQLAVREAGFFPGDEVLTTPFTFVATGSVICHEGLKPVFCDIDPFTLNMDLAEVTRKVTPRTKGLLAVHIFGLSADLCMLRRIAEENRLVLIEDACEALGASFRGIKAGTAGRSGVFAFYPNKQITTGEGGMVIADNPELGERFRRLRNHGRTESRPGFEQLGFNFRLSELGAALGVVQMERLEQILISRRMRVQWYREELASVDELTCMGAEPGRSPFVFYVIFKNEKLRDWVGRHLRERGIECEVYFPPLHLLKPFKFLGYREGDLPCAESTFRRILCLPFWTDMPREVVRRVAQEVASAVAAFSE